MRKNEEKKEYKKPDLEYVAFDYSVVVLASEMGKGEGEIEGSDESAEGI